MSENVASEANDFFLQNSNVQKSVSLIPNDFDALIVTVHIIPNDSNFIRWKCAAFLPSNAEQTLNRMYVEQTTFIETARLDAT